MLFEHDCEKRRIKVVYRSLPESDPATEMLMKSMLQAFDEYHSLISRAKGLAGMAENVHQGWRAGGRAPRGYTLHYTATGAIREGSPVLKSRLVVDESTAPQVQAYLRQRAQGVARGTAIARLQLQWPASSTHSMDWQALTYAGHTVWNMHAERQARGAADVDKRRSRAEWVIHRNTHPALIEDHEAEAILAQQERAQQGRRVRDSPLLLTGLLVTHEGGAWHSDGCGHYRLGKGRKISAARLETAVLARLASDLASDQAVATVHQAMEELAGGEPVDGRRLVALERKISTLTTQIGRTVDLAASLDDPAPVLRRVQDLEHQRTELIAELGRLRQQREQLTSAARITLADVRALLRRFMADIGNLAQEDERRAEARLSLHQVLDRVELDPLATVARLHYAVQTGDTVASPRGTDVTPVVRWVSPEITLARRRAA